jgi:hypothetical protein
MAENYPQLDRTMNLHEAADFLHMSPAVLRQKAKARIISGAKPGKRWVFLQSDLVAYLKSLYAGQEQAPCCDKEVIPCHYISAAVRGGSNLRLPTDSSYADLLELPIDDSPRNFTTD